MAGMTGTLRVDLAAWIKLHLLAPVPVKSGKCEGCDFREDCEKNHNKGGAKLCQPVAGK